MQNDNNVQDKKINSILELSEDEINLPISDIHIKRLKVSTRSINGLLRAGITKVDQLLTMPIEDLDKIRNMGKVSKGEVISAINILKDEINISEENKNKVVLSLSLKAREFLLKRGIKEEKLLSIAKEDLIELNLLGCVNDEDFLIIDEDKLLTSEDKVSNLSLSRRTVTSLSYNGIYTIGTLLLKYPGSYCSVNGIGEMSREEINSLIERIYSDSNITFEFEYVKNLKLSTRSINGLLRAGITKVDQLLTMPIEDLDKIRNMGKVSKEEVISVIEELNNGAMKK